VIYKIADMICPPFSEANSLFHAEDMLAICHGLLILTSTTGMALGLVDESKSKIFQTVQLAHFSVKQYLVSSRTIGWSLDEPTAHISIILASIASYLHTVSFPDDLRDTSLGEVMMKHPLSDYAPQYAAQHLKDLAQHDVADLEESFRLLLDPKKQMLNNGLGMLFMLRSFIPITFDGLTPFDMSLFNLCLSASLGLPNMVQWLLTYDSVCRELDTCLALRYQVKRYSIGPAICEASRHGHIEVVQVLTDAGANVNQEASSIGPALMLAARHGHEQVVRLLLKCGAEMNKSGQRNGSPIQAAAMFGHNKIVSILAKAGAEINNVSAAFPSPLYAAAQDNNVELARMLIALGARVNDQSPLYGASIHVAAERGHQETIQVLLDAGANVNQPGSDYGSALGIASLNGHVDVVRVLLKAGADVNMPCILRNSERDSSGYQTKTVYKGGAIMDWPHINLVIRDGFVSGLNQSTEQIGYAILAAVQQGHHDIVQILLDAGSDVSLEGGYFNQSPLYTACERRDVPLIQILLDHGANVNQRGGPCGSALQQASSKGETGIVRMLLRAGANVDPAGGYYGSPLQAASYNGFPETVRVLLDAGANVNKHGPRFCSALIAASSQGYAEIVEILLDSGAAFNCSSCHAGSAIYEARVGKHEDIVRMLLDAGADPNETDPDRHSETCLRREKHTGTTQLASLLGPPNGIAGYDTAVEEDTTGVSSETDSSEDDLDAAQIAALKSVDTNTGEDKVAVEEEAVRAGDRADSSVAADLSEGEEDLTEESSPQNSKMVYFILAILVATAANIAIALGSSLWLDHGLKPSRSTTKTKYSRKA
jgi:ankyrin repeat protein